ncbi:unnamed protein product [Peniophora sp. CBMAI 1063]|nr:unnamed protein product [Peniophora sp. CBMAI 1063]
MLPFNTINFTDNLLYSPMADILVLGANGYSGRLIAKYLLEHPQRNTFRLALAARSRSKLEAAKLPLDSSVELWEVDLANEAALEETIGKVSVVVNCIGPYWRTGTPIVRACVRQGKHYVDICGETHWIYDIIRLFDFHATRTRSIIVPSCGFDSAPSDALVYITNRTLKAKFPYAQIIDSVTAVDMNTGGAGAGTLQTVLSTFGEVPRSVLELSSQAYALSPVHGGKAYPAFNLLYTLPKPFSHVTGSYSLLGGINRAIVERTFGIFELDKSSTPKQSYGPRFRYDEFLVRKGYVNAFLASMVIAFSLFALVFFAPARWLFRILIPSSGNGPSEAKLKAGYLTMTNVSTATTGSEMKQRARVKSELRSNTSPLYLTSIIAGEAALSLLDPSQLPELARKGGLLTPMTAFGGVLLERLETSGHCALSAEMLDYNGCSWDD